MSLMTVSFANQMMPSEHDHLVALAFLPLRSGDEMAGSSGQSLIRMRSANYKSSPFAFPLGTGLTGLTGRATFPPPTSALPPPLRPVASPDGMMS